MAAKKPKAAKKALSKDALKRIKGGDNSTVDVTVNVAKTNQKTFETDDKFIRG